MCLLCSSQLPILNTYLLELGVIHSCSSSSLPPPSKLLLQTTTLIGSLSSLFSWYFFRTNHRPRYIWRRAPLNLSFPNLHQHDYYLILLDPLIHRSDLSAILIDLKDAHAVSQLASASPSNLIERWWCCRNHCKSPSCGCGFIIDVNSCTSQNYFYFYLRYYSFGKVSNASFKIDYWQIWVNKHYWQYISAVYGSWHFQSLCLVLDSQPNK